MHNVMVVDDDRTNTQLMQMVLEMDGYAVVVCPTVASATKAIEPSTAAFIVDYYLAGAVKGVALVELIRGGATAAAVNAPIIVTSGDDRRRSEALAAGADLFLLKPYGPSTLSAALKQLLVTDEIDSD